MDQQRSQWRSWEPLDQRMVRDEEFEGVDDYGGAGPRLAPTTSEHFFEQICTPDNSAVEPVEPVPKCLSLRHLGAEDVRVQRVVNCPLVSGFSDSESDHAALVGSG